MIAALFLAGVLGVFGPPVAVSPQTTPASAATDLIATLDAVCVAAEGDAARAAELAVEAGYSPVPASMVPNLRNSSEQAAFMKSSATDVAFILTGRMSRRVGRERIVMDVCGVTARPAEHRPLEQRLRSVMGFAPVRDGGMEVYAWVQTPQGRAPTRELGDPTFIAMAGTGQMRMVGAQRSGPGSTVMYFLPRLD